MSAEYQDQTRICVDCHNEFLWSAGEQEYFHEKGFAEPPKRCKECRRARKERRGETERQKGGWKG